MRRIYNGFTIVEFEDQFYVCHNTGEEFGVFPTAKKAERAIDAYYEVAES